MTTHARRSVLGFLVALGIVGFLVYAFWPQRVPVDVTEVARGPLQVTIDGEGRTRVREVYIVSAPVAGSVLRIESKVGDAVVAGETVLATLRPADPTILDRRSRRQAEATVKAAEAAQTLAKAEVVRAQVEQEFLRAELDRKRKLADRGTVSQSTLDRAEMEAKTSGAALDTARAALRVKEFELENARAQLIGPLGEPGPDGGVCCVEVHAPVDGRVLRIMQKSEGVVAAGEPLIEVGNLADIEIVVDLLSADAVQVSEGAAVSIEDWGGGRTLAGLVRRVEPYGFTKVSALGIEEQRVNVIIDFNDPPERRESLAHGFRVMARIAVWQSEDVLKAPMGALFRDRDRWAVFVMADGLAHLRHVEVGQANGREAEITAGLEAGERVILHPSDLIADEVRVELRPEG
jgi:HlyD family secretion protein